MKTGDILNKVTLKFAGGGKLKLSDYGPYISNTEENVEGLGSGNNPMYETKYEPAAYLVVAYKDVNAMWAAKDVVNNDNNIYNLTENKVFTKDELKEYIESLWSVFGRGDNIEGDIACLYKDNNIHNEYICSAINQYQQDGDGWGYLFTDNPILCTSEFLEEVGASDSEIQLFNDLTNQGYYMYLPGEVDEDIWEEAEFDESKNEEYMADYGVKLYVGDEYGKNTSISFKNGPTIYLNQNIFYDESRQDLTTGSYYVWMPIGTFNINFNDQYFNIHNINTGDQDGESTYPFEWPFNKNDYYYVSYDL